MIRDIDKNISLINETIAWAKDYGKDSFPIEQFKEYRRKLSKIRKALIGNCSAAAYGESQVGKSYLMSSLLSSSDHPFVIENNGKEYSFIDELNPSGGNNNKIESTGVVTRFTIKKGNPELKDYVKILNLSVVDLILLLTDSYYNDIKIDIDSALSVDEINHKLNDLFGRWSNKPISQNVIQEDDIRDINEYIKEVIGNGATAIYQSNFCKIVAPLIQSIPSEEWGSVFSLLWNQNPEISRLFDALINAYRKIDFRQNIYVPFDAVLREKGTLLKIEWLDTICGVKPDMGNDQLFTDIYDNDGNLISRDFNKGELSALIAELTFELPESIAKERKFLQKMDLLDFPGARSREKYKEKEIATVLPKMLRRGKVAYLFNKYSRTLQISSVLFCHHNDQKSEPTIGETINNWIEENIGASPEERSKLLAKTKGIAPLFLVATKFNIDLERTKNDKPENYETLDKHWNRFDTVLPEIIKPNSWLDEWMISANGETLPFRNIYPLRDFFWSGKNGLFDGYSDGIKKSPETSVHINNDYPDYMDRLKNSFVRNTFVRKHFSNPEETWSDVATLNNDGSKAIIRDLDSISDVLDDARRERYHKQLESIRNEMISALNVYFEPEDVVSKNKKVRLIARDIRGSLTQAVSSDPAVFGRIIDAFMVSAESIRNIAYDIIELHIDGPKDYSNVNLIRARADIDICDNRDTNTTKLLDYFMCDTVDELKDYIAQQGLDLNEIISNSTHTLSTIGDVVAKHVTDYWIDHLNNTAHSLTDVLPHADEVVFMLISLFNKLKVRELLSSKINRYTEVFSKNEQCNAIGDFAALTLNKFVSTVGHSYMPDSEISNLITKAKDCNIQIDVSSVGTNNDRQAQPLEQTLIAFEKATTIINGPYIDITILQQLPFWSNYQRWENQLMVGLVYSSDISHCDPVCNEKVKYLIDSLKPLYRA